MKDRSKQKTTKSTKTKKYMIKPDEGYQSLFYNNLAGIYKTTLDGEIVNCNDSFARMLGYDSKEELLKLRATDLYFSSSDRNNFLNNLKQNKVLNASTCLLKRRDGSRCWILENAFIDKDNFITGTVIDITERERVEESLLEVEERYRLLVEMSPICIAIHINGKFIFVNNSAVKLLKAKSKEDILGKSIFDFIAPEYHTVVKERINEMQSEMKGVPLIEEKLVCLDGSKVTVEIAGVPIFYHGISAYQIVFQNVSERKQLYSTIIKSELKYKELTELLPQPIFEVDDDGKILFLNVAGQNYFGVTQSGIDRGINMFDFIVPNEHEIVKRNIEVKFNGGTPPRRTYKLINKEGQPFHAIIYSSPVVKDGILIGLRGIILDITEKNNIEEYERKRKDKIIWYQAALLELDKIDKTDSNKAIKKVCEIDAQTLGVDFVSVWTRVGETLDIFCNNIYDLHEDVHKEGIYMKVDEDRANYVMGKLEEDGMILVDDVLTNEITRDFKEEYFLPKDISSLLYVPVWAQGVIVGMVCHECKNKREWALEEINFTKSISDIVSIVLLTTEKKKAADILKKSEAHYRAIVEDQTELICRFLPDKTLIFVNEAYCRFFNKEREELIGEKFTELIPNEDIHIVEENISRLSPVNPIITYEHRVLLDNGGIKWQQWIDRVIACDEKGKILEFQAVGRDITLQKEMELELIESRKKIEESNKLKSIFLGNMSHELRTPITGILGLTEVLRDDLEKQTQTELADKIINSTKRLMSALNLLITISETESQKTEIKKSEVDLINSSITVIKQFDKIIKEKNLYLKLNAPGEKIKAILDVNLLKTSIECIIDNAVKFTRTGGITVDISKTNSDQKSYGLIKISDTGIGIAKENHGIIFKEFKQLSEGMSRQFEGFGLGLTVAKRLTELMGGTIEIESELGQGTTISLIFEISC